MRVLGFGVILTNQISWSPIMVAFFNALKHVFYEGFHYIRWLGVMVSVRIRLRVMVRILVGYVSHTILVGSFMFTRSFLCLLCLSKKGEKWKKKCICFVTERPYFSSPKDTNQTFSLCTALHKLKNIARIISYWSTSS